MGKDQVAVSQAPMTGRALDGRYRLENEIGAGGLGVVYRATHEKLAKLVAIKLLHAHCGENAVMRGRFEREAKALASLEHPNIVAVTDFGIADDTPYLVMELLEGETLADRLARGALDEASATTLSTALLEALAFVHARGLVHRDVKPGNVFLQHLSDGDERLKVLDFGLAKFVEPFDESTDPTLTRAGSIVGTPAYMSPEQASGEVADARSDVYAAGVILLQMLAGRLPFLGDAIDQLRSHLIAPVPKLGELCANRKAEPAFDAFIERALAKRREDRFANADEMLTALQALPRPWFRDVLGVRGTDLGMANTLLAVEPATVAASGAREVVAEHVPPTPLLVVRSSKLFVGVAVSAVAIAVFAAAYAVRHPELAVPAMFDQHPASAALVHQPPPSAAVKLTVAKPRSPEPSANDETVPSAAPSATPAPQELQPSEAELDEPTQANVAPKPRVAARDPWRRAVPKELRALRSAIQKGERGNDRTVAVLVRYIREHPSDVRGHVLLGDLYMNRDWRGDAIGQYAAAYQLDASARGAPEMLPNLLACIVHGFTVSEAERFIERNYRSEALPAIERILRGGHEDVRAAARLTALKSRLQARWP